MKMNSLKVVGVVAAVALATPAYANKEAVDVKVFDHTKIVTQYVPYTELVCTEVKKPIYGEVNKEGNAAAGALTGMIIGGLIGKAAGDDKGAAAGAVVGGLIGADKGSKPQSTTQVVGYEIVEQCKEVKRQRKKEVEVYSHSTVRFYVDGKRYVVEFKK